MKNIKQYTTVLFDLDGTLLDTLDDLADSVNYALQLYDYPAISVADTRRFVGNGQSKLMERAIPGGVNNPHFSECLEQFINQYKCNMMNRTKPYPGILELLTELEKRNYRMAVVSNKNDIPVKTLAKHYFGEFIQTAIGTSATIPGKPEPVSVYMALEELGVDKKDAIYVGDSDIDILTAHNAGLPCICVSWGFRDKEFLEKNGASCIIAHPFDLLATLEEGP